MPFFQDFLIHALMAHLGRDEFDATPCVRLVVCAAALRIGRQELTMKQEKLLK
jgi:hypothetical protein